MRRNASNAGSSQESARVCTTGEEPYSPHLCSDISTTKPPLLPLAIACVVLLVVGIIDGVLNNTNKPWYRNMLHASTQCDWVLVMVSAISNYTLWVRNPSGPFETTLSLRT
ncbi:hypothetical protein O6H91_05G026600 [Diphasiastrum complanatum]|uniref:Uncharacterized protein n=1 Tax=Diphasiastrum complanatum TaxID=34168 RepID=A0ACC2DLP6_DIPCM|nr:hypothetical protein O6H91_05G026600 [Diphasiastrum complanatum]